jgi:hypothetical protein
LDQLAEAGDEEAGQGGDNVSCGSGSGAHN